MNHPVNYSPKPCYYCGLIVPAQRGVAIYRPAMKTYDIAHRECARNRSSQVVEIATGTGEKIRRNKAGRCLDAPHCGCCSP